MTTFHAKQHTLLVGKESTFGTAVTTDKDLGLIQSLTPSDKREYTKVKATGSREVQELVAGKEEYSIDTELFIQNGRIFEFLLGTKDSSTETTGDWKHIFSIGEEIPSFTLENSFNATVDAVSEYAGVKFDSGQIVLDTNGILKYSGSMIGKDLDISGVSASAAVLSALKVLAFKHTTLSTGSAGSETSVGKLQSFTLNFANTVAPVDSAGTTQAQEIIAGDSEITIEFSMSFESTTEYQKFLGGTTPAVQPASTSMVINANNGVTLGSGRREFEVQLAEVQYEEVGAPVNVGEMVVQNFKGSCTGLGTDKLFVVDTVSDSNF